MKQYTITVVAIGRKKKQKSLIDITIVLSAYASLHEYVALVLSPLAKIYHLSIDLPQYILLLL